jgi:hypothetical protein
VEPSVESYNEQIKLISNSLATLGLALFAATFAAGWSDGFQSYLLLWMFVAMILWVSAFAALGQLRAMND